MLRIPWAEHEERNNKNIYLQLEIVKISGIYDKEREPRVMMIREARETEINLLNEFLQMDSRTGTKKIWLRVKSYLGQQRSGKP